MTKSQELSRQIIEKITEVAAVRQINGDGATAVRAGFDHVCGEGAYDRLVSDLYFALRAKAGV